MTTHLHLSHSSHSRGRDKAASLCRRLHTVLDLHPLLVNLKASHINLRTAAGMHTESEDDQDFSTELLFERAFIATSLNYNGVRVEPASLNGKAMTLMANAVFNSAFVVGEWIDRGFLDFADGHSGETMLHRTESTSLQRLTGKITSLSSRAWCWNRLADPSTSATTFHLA